MAKMDHQASTPGELSFRVSKKPACNPALDWLFTFFTKAKADISTGYNTSKARCDCPHSLFLGPGIYTNLSSPLLSWFGPPLKSQTFLMLDTKLYLTFASYKFRVDGI